MSETCDECAITWSDRTIAFIGLVVGIGVVLMAADLLTGGAVTRSVIPARKLAQVIDFPGGADDATA